MLWWGNPRTIGIGVSHITVICKIRLFYIRELDVNIFLFDSHCINYEWSLYNKLIYKYFARKLSIMNNPLMEEEYNPVSLNSGI